MAPSPPAGKPDTSAISVDGEDQRENSSGPYPERQKAGGSEGDAEWRGKETGL